MGPRRNSVMKHIVLNSNDEGLLMTVKFAVLQKMTAEYFLAIEDKLMEEFELNLSTVYRSRFTKNRKQRKEDEKEMKMHMDKFKSRFRAFKQKNNALYDHMEQFRSKEYNQIENAVEQIYDYIDQLIVVKDGETK